MGLLVQLVVGVKIDRFLNIYCKCKVGSDTDTESDNQNVKAALYIDDIPATADSKLTL